ncbi:hypothetical protein BD289DRAFT_437576 [Coniella lustricola]|uniref:WSC domain-containing protein n=1 Tax=Coniella lustricola TaxID=2025994 RepID=A0A2T3A3U7_9PEZI|nr:hypothetical protein BD289DRAFT_437576 [Coniella lustricola]
MTVVFCLDMCAEYGYIMAGVENGKDCGCSSSKSVTSDAFNVQGKFPEFRINDFLK